MPKISIIIPVYNVEAYINECLASCLNQTLKDIEIICIDDGSSDNSLNILNEYKNNDERIKIITQTNQGQGIARNNAINEATGEYIVFADPDDWLELDALENIYNYFKDTNAEVIQFNYTGYDEYTCEYRKYDLKEEFLNVFNYDLLKNNSFNQLELGTGCIYKTIMAVWNKAYKTDYIKNNNIKFAPCKIGEDHIFTMKALFSTNRIYYLDKYIYIYRNRIGSSVNKTSDENFCIFDNIKLLRDFILEKGIFIDLEKEYREYIQNLIMWHYASIPVESKEKYKNMAHDILTDVEYKHLLKKIKSDNSKWQNIFSIRNKKINGIKHKVITILGLKIMLKVKRGRNK